MLVPLLVHMLHGKVQNKYLRHGRQEALDKPNGIPALWTGNLGVFSIML